MLTKILNHLYRLCLYTTLITLFFYFFALITDFTTASMPLGRYASILLYAALLCAAELPFSTHLPRPACRLLHYSLSLFGFLLVFLLISGIGFGNGARTFVLIVFFSLLYFIIVISRFFIYRAFQCIAGGTTTSR